MRRSVAASLAVALVAALLVVAGSAPAQARSTRVDPRDARGPIDTRRVALYPNFRGYLVVQAYSRTYDVGRRFNGIEVGYDTAAGPGPDYRLIWNFRKDGDGHDLFTLVALRRGEVVGTVDCPGARGKGRPRIRAIEITVPRSCLRFTKRPGARVATWDYTRYNRSGVPTRGFRDLAPNRGYLR